MPNSVTLNHTHVPYENFVLANEIEDQFNSKLDLVRFCTVDNSLVGVPGMKKVIHVYSATDGTEKLVMGQGNSQNIEVSYDDTDYEILMAQNRFPYYDEEEMKDPLIVQTGLRHMATDMFNTVNGEVYSEFKRAQLAVAASKPDFGAFADAEALLNRESVGDIELFAFVHPKDMAIIRKTLADDLKYVEAFARTGYVGTVAGINLYIKKDADYPDGSTTTKHTIFGGTREAVTLFNKKGVEVEQKRDANVRLNEIYSRKYYLAALTDATKAFKIEW